jgi:hypothetical protein
MARFVADRFVAVGSGRFVTARLGAVWCAMFRIGIAGQARPGKVCCGLVRPGWVRQGRCVVVRCGLLWQRQAWRGSSRQVGLGADRFGTLRFVMAGRVGRGEFR